MARDHTGLEVLSVKECIRLLQHHPVHVGRVAVADPRPTIFPINYRMHDDNVVFRTDAGTKLDAAVRNQYVAFEVDAVDPAWREGWSVLVRGQAQEVTDEAALERLRQLPLHPWAPGAKGHFVVIEAEQISGRRII